MIAEEKINCQEKIFGANDWSKNETSTGLEVDDCEIQ